MTRHLTAVALAQLLSGPPNEAETARAIQHLAHCHRCLATAAKCVAQLKGTGISPLGVSDSRLALIKFIEEETSSAVEALKARGWWAEVRELSPAEQIKKIQTVTAMRSLTIFETILSEATVAGRSDPFLGQNTAQVAFFVADHLPEPRYSRALKNDLRGEAMIVVANCRRIAADWTGSAEALSEARRHLARGTGEQGLAAKLLSIQASLRMDVGAIEEALSTVRQAVERFREAEDWSGVAHAAVQEASYLIAADQAAEAIEMANFALQRIPSHNLRLQVLSRFIIVDGLVMLERPQEALLSFMAAEPMFGDVDLGTRLRIAYYGARVLDGLGLAREAEKLFRTAVKNYFEHELYKEGFTTLLTLFESFCLRGALEKAAALCEEAIIAASQSGTVCNDLIRRAWEDLLTTVRIRQLNDIELAHARQFLVRNWCVPEGGALVLPRLEAAVARANPVVEYPPPPPPPASDQLGGGTYKAALEAYDRELIAAALKEAGGSIKATARYLGISRNGLRDKVRKYGLAGGDSLTED